MKLKFYLFLFFIASASSVSNLILCQIYNTRLLIKMPTRSRPDKFFRTLKQYYDKLSHQVPYHFLITCDIDDITMNNSKVIGRLKTLPNLTVNFSANKSKIEAYNKDMQLCSNFDIVLVTSDDMNPVAQNYDRIIVEKMLQFFPDYDGVLNFHDGYVGADLNTYPVIGKKYYQRFGYIYYPAYKSLFCDNELTLVSRMLKKEAVFNQVIIRHNHPAWGAAAWDDLYIKNEQLKAHDEFIFKKRLAINFGINR